jgi:hypothetical protein
LVTTADVQGVTSVTLRAGDGQQRRFVTAREKIDTDLAISLAERQLAAAGPAWAVLRGAFLALDPDGDISQARVAWKWAAQQGFAVDALMAEVDYRFP